MQVYSAGSALIGSFAALAGALYMILRKVSGKRAESISFNKITFSIVLVLLILLGYCFLQLRQYQHQSKVSLLASEYRDDFEYTAHRYNQAVLQSEFSTVDTKQFARYDLFAANIARDPHPYLIDLRLPFWHDSGFIISSGKIFTNIYPSEFIAVLEKIVRDNPSPDKTLYLVSFRPTLLMYYQADQISSLRALLKQFKSVQHFPVDLYSSQYIGQDLKVKDVHGNMRQASWNSDINVWPLVAERFLLDQKHVRFPRIDYVLKPKKLAQLITKPEVVIVLPSASFYRDQDVYRVTTQQYFDSVKRRGDVIYLDYSSPNIRQDIAEAIQKIRGRLFVCAGYGKFDCAHYGLDFAYQVYQDSQRQNVPFRFQGYSNQLPEAVSYLVVSQKGRLYALKIMLQEAFAAAFVASQQKKLPPVLFFIFLGAILRVVFLPVILLEISQRRNRSRWYRLLNILPDGLFKKTLQRRRKWGMRLFGYSYELEVLILAAAIFPLWFFYVVINPVDLDLMNQMTPHQLGMAGVLLFALICVIMLLNGIYVEKKRRIAGNILMMGSIGAILVAIIFVTPNVGLLYFMIGVSLAEVFILLSVQLFIRFDAFNPARESISPDQRMDAVDIVRLSASQQWRLGNKAERLGFLKDIRCPLFQVVDGFIVPAALIKTDLNEALDTAVRHSFIQKPSKFIVRSSAANEDGSVKSLAGKYLTILDVEHSALAGAIENVAASMVSAGTGSSVLIQEMKRFSFSGVLFTQSYRNKAVSLIEYVDGQPDKMIQGQTAALQINIGRYSGDIIGGDELSSGKRSVFLQLQFIGFFFEKLFGAPQDIEWGYDDAVKQLYILQTRNITVFTHDAALENYKRELIVRDFDGFEESTTVLKSDLDFIQFPTPLTADILSRLYACDGAFDKALRKLELRRSPAVVPYGDFMFGRFFLRQKVGRQHFGEQLLNGWGYIRLAMSLSKGGREFETKIQAKIYEARIFREQLIKPGASRSGEKLISDISNAINYYFDQYCPDFFSVQICSRMVLLKKMNKAFFSTDKTKTMQYLEDLARFSREGNAEYFLSKWGHRSDTDYELSKKTFAEDPAAIAQYAQKFSALKMATESRQGITRFDVLREEVKDEMLHFFAELRSLFLELARKLNVSEEDIFYCQLDEISRCRDEGLRKIIVERKALWKKFAEIKLLESIRLTDLETMDWEHQRRELGFVKGEHISISQEFQGVVRFDRNSLSSIKEGEVIFCETLQPALIPFFPVLRGCIVKSANALSHTAIVARELGCPILEVNASLEEGMFVVVSRDGILQIKQQDG